VEDDMAHAITVKTLRPQPIATIRTTSATATIGATLGQILPEVFAYVVAQGQQPAGPPFTRYLDDSGETIELEAGIPVAAPIAGNGRVQAGALPGGPVATIWHVGPYDTLTATYDVLAAWMAAEGRARGGPFWEVYWTNPQEVPDPAEWKTEIVCPLRT
jgi:effector-binding domain-containing protein